MCFARFSFGEVEEFPKWQGEKKDEEGRGEGRKEEKRREGNKKGRGREEKKKREGRGQKGNGGREEKEKKCATEISHPKNIYHSVTPMGKENSHGEGRNTTPGPKMCGVGVWGAREILFLPLKKRSFR